MKGIAWFLAVFAVAVAGGYFMVTDKPALTPRSHETFPTQADLDGQPTRKQIINAAIEEKMLMKVRVAASGGIAWAQVDRGYYGLPFDSKKQFAEILWQHEAIQAGTLNFILVFQDGYSGKEVATYTIRGFSPK